MKNNINGWIILDKPAGISSNNALVAVRRALNAKKVGHAGTLDPLASGILPLALGEATKVISYAMDHEKTYVFSVGWGEERTTDDLEGEVTYRSDSMPTVDQIQEILPQFHGEILQIPPIYSAIKIQGKRACDHVRAGENIALPPRKVYVRNLQLLSFLPSGATFQMVCSKGTYVRSLARDMARALGTYGHVTALRRTAVGPFVESQAVSLEKLLKLGDIPQKKMLIHPLAMVLDDIPAVVLSDEEVDSFRKGRRPPLGDAGIHMDADTKAVLCIDMTQNPIGLGELQEGFIQPVRVFNL